jgi:hypothetical protein
MAIGTLASIIGKIDEDKAKKSLNRTLENAPKYKITDEAFENQAIAKSAAYGRDRAIQQQQENISQEATNDAFEAKNITSSTSALLSTIAQINANKNQNLRGLGQTEAAMQRENRGALMGANNAMIDEKDKAWNYNENMPFQMRVAMYRDKQKSAQEMQLAGLAYESQTTSAFASSIGGMMGACDVRLKDEVEPIESGLDDIMKLNPVTFKYIHPQYLDGKTHNGFLAHEVKKVIPQAVSEIPGDMTATGDPYSQVDFKELIPTLVKALQEQQQQIWELSRQLASQKRTA